MYGGFRFSALFLFFVATACSAGEFKKDGEIQFACPGGKQLQFPVEIVRSQADRAKGLMYRKSLPEDSGMFFVFPGMQERTFWMKNTFIPLDIFFIAESGTIVTAIENVPPLTTTPRKSIVPAKYALELNGGAGEKFGLVEGCKLDVKFVE